MSGFIKRERSVNTVNPAGGINLASSPNVGQYGWTNYDSAVVNQLIGYAELAKDSADAAKEYADYIYSQIAAVDEATLFIAESLEDFNPKYQDSLVKYATLQSMYDNMESIHEIVVKYYDDIVKIAANVHEDSIAAKSWAFMTYILYLESRGELTNKGNWNTDTGLPAVPTTNAIWLVTTGGKIDVDIGGFLWNEGDHLAFTLREGKFNQIKKSFYTFTARDATLTDTITEMQREISELKEKLNEHVF